MGNILRFSTEISKEEWMRDVADAITGGDRVAVLIEQADGSVLTAYWQCDPSQKQVLLGHMQVDIIDDYMRATYGLARD